MIKRDYTVELTKGYLAILRAGSAEAFTKVYNENLPLSIVPYSGPYVLIKNMSGRNTTAYNDKNGYGADVNVEVHIMQDFTGNINPVKVEAAADELIGLINQDLQPELTMFKCHTATMASNEQVIEYSNNGLTVKRKIVFEHYIEQTEYGTHSGEFNNDFNDDFNI